MQEVKTHPKQFYHTFAHFGAIGWEGCNMYYLQQQKKTKQKVSINRVRAQQSTMQ